MLISCSDIGCFTNSCDWACWTSPKEAKDDFNNLVEGCVLEEDIYIWENQKGTIEVPGLEMFAHVNLHGQTNYLVPAGTRVKLIPSSELISEDCGNHFWDDHHSDHTYSHHVEGTIIINY